MVQDNPESFGDLDGHMNSAATASQTSLCDVTTGEGCTYEQRGYISVIIRSPSEPGSHDITALANKINLLSPPGWPYAIAFHPLVSVAQCLKDIAACQQKSEHPSFFKVLEMSATMVACFQICPALRSGGAVLAVLGLLPDPPMPTVYRGGTNLEVRPGIDVKVDSQGMVQPGRGISLSTDASSLEKFGGAHQVESIPRELEIVQRGRNPNHYEIVAREPMTVERYQELVRQIKLK